VRGHTLATPSIKGFLETSFVDWPGRMASVVFLPGCNFRCPYCHNHALVLDPGAVATWPLEVVLAKLSGMKGWVDGVCVTGGEPTLLGERLFQLIRQCKSYLPNTALHILSNGRAFVNAEFTEKLAAIGHHDLMVGIPIYSDLSDVHDYVVQADGAFDETIRGILNLKKLKQRVEIRVVIHKQTYERLPELARFIARNLTFVDQVVLMGLEMTGFTKANLHDLWIDPLDYQPQLLDATRILSDNRVRVSIYNHQLCITNRALWPYARQSISDWKNEYMPECEGCAVRAECGGFFSAAKLRYSDHIKPILNS
jgi:His-Xaa-Ser system radical SAM maturase HxsC